MISQNLGVNRKKYEVCFATVFFLLFYFTEHIFTYCALFYFRYVFLKTCTSCFPCHYYFYFPWPSPTTGATEPRATTGSFLVNADAQSAHPNTQYGPDKDKNTDTKSNGCGFSALFYSLMEVLLYDDYDLFTFLH